MKPFPGPSTTCPGPIAGPNSWRSRRRMQAARNGLPGRHRQSDAADRRRRCAYDAADRGCCWISSTARRRPISIASSIWWTSGTSPCGHILAADKGRIGERYILGGRNIRMKDLLAPARHVGRAADAWPQHSLLAGVEHRRHQRAHLKCHKEATGCPPGRSPGWPAHPCVLIRPRRSGSWECRRRRWRPACGKRWIGSLNGA